jgi:methionyl-tRNA synthetase
MSSEGAKKHLVTAALPYANGPLHIGHIAGAYLPADIYVRFLRQKGEDVVFICGSDEHGAAITMRAKKEGITPQEIVDKYHAINKKAFADFGIDFSIYHRTSDASHHETAQAFFKVLNEKGAFELIESEQYFDEEHQQFLADRYITGTCPKCSNENAYGDQCEKCGSALSPTDLINPVSTLSGKTPVLKSTRHWYLPMQNHEAWLKEWITDGKLDGAFQHDPTTWRKQVVGQCLSWIDGGLAPRAMTRDLDWGVKVPLEGADGKVLYVWLDAPIGYISATKAWAAENGADWNRYWQDEHTELTHFIAKDNIVFHCIIFPILLKEHGGFNLPVNVPANEFLNLEGDKISTSREWAVWLHEYMEDFPGRIDELRYVLTSIAPESKDSEFTWKDYQTRVNSELVAILGNFVNRAFVLVNKYYQGVIPTPGEQLEIDQTLKAELNALPALIEEKLKAHKYRDGLTLAMQIARLGNKYLADTEPWKVQKTDPERTATILYNALDVAARIGHYLKPFLPTTCAKINTALQVDVSGFVLEWQFPMVPRNVVETPELLFKKVEDENIEEQVKKLEEKAAAKAGLTKNKAVKETISFDDFTKLDIRVGEILTAERVPKADKLLKLSVKVGGITRTVVSGIAAHYAPEDLTGKRVSLLLNLAPRKIRGVLSEGMILMAEDESGALSFVNPDKADFPHGGDIR